MRYQVPKPELIQRIGSEVDDSSDARNARDAEWATLLFHKLSLETTRWIQPEANHSCDVSDAKEARDARDAREARTFSPEMVEAIQPEARDAVDARDARDARRRLCGRAISGQEDIARHRSDRVSDRYLTLIRR